MTSITVNSPDTTEYPCLLVNPAGMVVLFKAISKGTVVHEGNPSIAGGYKLGLYSEQWQMDRNWTRYGGVIKLSN